MSMKQDKSKAKPAGAPTSPQKPDPTGQKTGQPPAKPGVPAQPAAAPKKQPGK